MKVKIMGPFTEVLFSILPLRVFKFVIFVILILAHSLSYDFWWLPFEEGVEHVWSAPQMEAWEPIRKNTREYEAIYEKHENWNFKALRGKIEKSATVKWPIILT